MSSFPGSDGRADDVQNRSKRNQDLALVLLHHEECIVALDQLAFDRHHNGRTQCDRHVFAD